MTAQIVILAEFREHRARPEWSGDPLVWTREGIDWMGAWL